MRLAALLLLAALVQAAVPTIARSGPAVQPYDLQATAPWMPLLWDSLAVTLPTNATAAQIQARFVSGADGSDLLALREGHRLTLSGGSLTVAGRTGTWTQTGGVLTIDLPGDAEAVRLVCRQLCYANLGGVRVLTTRRIGVKVRGQVAGLWQDSAELTLDVAPSGADAPPLLRFEPVPLVRGVAADLRPVDWYDGRCSRTDLRWRIAGTSVGLVVSGATPPGNWHTYDQFTTDAFTLTGSVVGENLCTVVVDDGAAQREVSFACPVTVPSGELSLIGDFPFAVSERTTVTFRSSPPGLTLTSCLFHPANGSGPQGSLFITVTRPDGGLDVIIDPAWIVFPWWEGVAVFSTGEASCSLPFRIRIEHPPAN